MPQFNLLFLSNNLGSQGFDAAEVSAGIGVDLLGGESGFGEEVVHHVRHAAGDLGSSMGES
jgi:hypothetical protein